MGVFAYGAVTLLSEQSHLYNVEVSPQYQGYLNNVSSNTGDVTDKTLDMSVLMSDSITAPDTITGGLTLATSAVWAVVKAPFTIMGNYLEFVLATLGILQPPRIVVDFVIGVLSIILIFAVINVIVKART